MASGDDRKLHELGAIYERFLERVQPFRERTGTYIDALDPMVPEEAVSRALGGAPLLVAGLYDAPRVQVELIARCARVVETRVLLDITGVVARATVVQTFDNPGTDWVEATYLFPLPESAAVRDGFCLSCFFSAASVPDAFLLAFFLVLDFAFVFVFVLERCASSLRVSLRRPRCALPRSRPLSSLLFLPRRSACVGARFASLVIAMTDERP